jgi:glycosyl hydrolase family 12
VVHQSTQTRSRSASRLGGVLAVSAAVLTGSLVAVAPAQAAVVTDCTRWGTTPVSGGTYIYQQNEWNSTSQQCASIDDAGGAFTLTSANMSVPTSGAPATYPSIFKGCHWGECTANSGMPIRVSDLASATTSWSTTQVESGAYDVAYDLWFNSTPTTTGQPDGTEVMIWMNSRGGVQPFGSKAASAAIAGKQWDIWVGQQAGWKIISYVLMPGATSFANLDTKALIDDAVARGSINPAHYLIDAEAGFEVWQGGQGLASNSFSFSTTTR